MTFHYNDGGRQLAGYKGGAGDCVVRAIAIGVEKAYTEVYEELFRRNKKYANGRCKIAKRLKCTGGSPRNENFRRVYEDYLVSLGYKWVPAMTIGSGCKVHLKENELPKGRLIVAVSKHLTAVIDGCIHDTHDCSRGGTRCVYGYYVKEV